MHDVGPDRRHEGANREGIGLDGESHAPGRSSKRVDDGAPGRQIDLPGKTTVGDRHTDVVDSRLHQRLRLIDRLGGVDLDEHTREGIGPVSVPDMPVVASFGDINVDLLASVDRHPPRGEESFASKASIGVGGSASNTAVALARLGFDSRILAQVGDDDFGLRALSRLVGAGVDTGYVVRSADQTTGINIVLVDPDGERTMIGIPGANRSYPGSPGWEDDSDWLHMSAYALLEPPQASAAIEALRAARETRTPFSFDVPSGVAAVLGSDLLRHLTGATIVAIGLGSLASVCPGSDPIRGLLDYRVDTVAVTDGDRPFTLRREVEEVTVEPPRVPNVDSTGAGDSFVAGLVAGRLRGGSLEGTAVLAAALGAAAVGVRGAGDELADPVRVKELLEDGRWAVDADWRREALDMARL